MQFINFPVFGYSIGVVFSTDVIRSIYDYHKNQHDLSDTAAAHVGITGSGRSHLFFDFKAEPGIIAHESWHAVYRMFEYEGMKLDDEAVAYHLGYLVKEVLKAQKKCIGAMNKFYREKRGKKRKK